MSDLPRISLGRSGFLFLMSLVIFSAVFIYMFFQLYLRVEDNIRLQSMAAVSQLASQLDAELGEIQNNAQVLSQLAELESLSDSDLQAMLETVLESLKNKWPIVFGGSVAFEPYQRSLTSRHTMYYRYFDHGVLVQGTRVGEDYDYFNRAWYVLPKMLGKPVWSEPYFDNGLTGELMTTCSVPFFRNGLNGERVFNGVVTVDIKLRGLCAKVQNMRLNEQGYSILLSRFGRYLAHPETALVMNESIFSSFDGAPEFRQLGRDMISGKKIFQKISKGHGYDGSMWLASAPVTQCGWSVGILYPERELFVSMKQTVLRLTVIGIGAIILQLLLAGLIAGHFNWIFKRLFK